MIMMKSKWNPESEWAGIVAPTTEFDSGVDRTNVNQVARILES